MNNAASRIILKSRREIELMRAAGAVVHRVLREIGSRVAPGVTTTELNRVAEEEIKRAGAKALFYGVVNPSARFPFPASICASVNAEVVHGIPDDRPLVEGDVVSIDCGVQLKGYCGDSAYTFAVGQIEPQTQRLLQETQEALAIAIREMRPQVRWSQVAAKMERHIRAQGFGIVREFVGHGIGREMHEEPKVPNYVDRDADFWLVPGMVLAVEPMVTAGNPSVDFRDRDRWTIVTRDGSCAAHYEHTIAITEDGCTVLTTE